MNDVFQSPEYRRSRVAYHIQCVTEYLVTLLVADAFLAKLLKSLGLSDSMVGVVSSLMSLAFLVQLLTIFLMQHIQNVKRTVLVIDITSMLCFMCTYFLPFVPVSAPVRTMLVFATIGGGFLFKYLQLNIYYKWGNSFVSPEGRGTFSARNEAISIGIGVVFTLIVGNLVDQYEKQGRLEACFFLIACTIAALTVIDFFMLLIIKKYSAQDAVRQQKSFRDVLRHTLGNRNFRNVVIMISLYDMGRYLTIGFLGTFKTQDLMLSVGTVQLINIAANGLRCVLSRPIGRWADRTSFAHVYRMGLWLCAISFLLLAFTTAERWWLIIAYTVAYDVSMAGIAGNANNMTYSYVPIDYFVQAQAVRSSIAGTLGFAASLVGGRLLAAVQAGGNRVLGIPLHGQQLLAILSFFIMLVAIAFNKRVVARQKVMKQ
ncbi:MAG TPA: MFS transporter [Candidatus Fimivicinus intestinavium]|nr:MFS transporter [Candidatus Fimivicinus intestinavium]